MWRLCAATMKACIAGGKANWPVTGGWCLRIKSRIVALYRAELASLCCKESICVLLRMFALSVSRLSWVYGFRAEVLAKYGEVEKEGEVGAVAMPL